MPQVSAFDERRPMRAADEVESLLMDRHNQSSLGVRAFVRSPIPGPARDPSQSPRSIEFIPSGEAADGATSSSAAFAPWNEALSSVSDRPRSLFFVVDGQLISTTAATLLRLLWNEFIRNPPQPNEAYTRLGPTNSVILPDFNIPTSVAGMRYPKWDNDFNRALWRHAKNNVPNANVLYFDIEKSEADQRPTANAMRYAAVLLARLRGLNVPLDAATIAGVKLNESLVIPWNTSLPMPSNPEAYTLGGVEVWSPPTTFPGPNTTGGVPTGNVGGTGTGSTTGGGGTGAGGGTGGLAPAKTNTTLIVAVVVVAVLLALAAFYATRRRA